MDFDTPLINRTDDSELLHGAKNQHRTISMGGPM